MKKYKKGKHEYTDFAKGARRVKKISKVKKITEVKKMNENKDQNPNQKQIPVKIDEETAMGKYANLCMIAHTPEEFTIDFMYMSPGPPSATPAAKVVSRIITSPGHAKRLQMALSENIAKYEMKHGVIAPSQMPNKKAGFN